MKTVKVNLDLDLNPSERSYEILIQAGLLTSNPNQQPFLIQAPICIVTSEIISNLYLETVLAFLRPSKIITVILPEGESAKTWVSLDQIFTALLSHSMPRSTVLVALGGGVMGDITGLAASLYQRGVPYVQIPTTLLAQVDASVGGKTAINHPLGKNMIGTFYQPKAVWIDPLVLNTLPDREYHAGLAEVIKYALIADADFFEFLEDHILKIKNRDPEVLTYMISRCCEIKACIVSQDEKDIGIRQYLNFGHTYGHALEAATHYEVFLHGEAVSLGMIYALKKSIEILNLDQNILDRTQNLLGQFNLPTEITQPQEILSRFMLRDKKNTDGQLRMVLLKQLGEAVVCAVGY